MSFSLYELLNSFMIKRKGQTQKKKGRPLQSNILSDRRKSDPSESSPLKMSYLFNLENAFSAA